MKNILLLFSLSLLVLAGCKKEEGPTTLRGIVVREDTGEPVPGIQVQAEVKTSRYSSGGYLGLDYVITGEDGKFDLTVNYSGAEDISSYYLVAIIPEGHNFESDYHGYLCDGRSICNGYQPNKTYNDITITLKTE